MDTRRLLVVAAVAGLGVAGGAGFTSAQASSAGPTHITIETAGVGTFKPNGFFKETVRYAKRSYTIATGGTITFEKGPKDKTPDPHTLTVVAASLLPKTALQVEECLGDAPGTGCAIGDSAKTDGAGIPLNKPGDTYALFPSKMGTYTPLTIKVTAPAGTTLNFMCAVHPWMQGVLHVVG